MAPDEPNVAADASAIEIPARVVVTRGRFATARAIGRLRERRGPDDEVVDVRTEVPVRS
jgi:hypothetical protein